MKLMVLLLCLFGLTFGDNEAEPSELSSSKLSPKQSLNSIPSAPAQKTTLIQQQPQQQYVQYKPVAQAQAQPAMLIIAQPGPQGVPGVGGGQHSPVFQQAVQQLLSYYNNNPQAKYQLLQQQQGVGQQHSYTPQMPTGALHVIPSPQLDNPQPSPSSIPAQHAQIPQHVQIPQNIPSQSQHPSQQPQATYIIPAQSLQALQGYPGLLAQLTGQLQQPQHQQHQQPQPQQPQHLPASVFPQQIPQSFPQSFPQQLLPQQIPQFAQHFALPPQFGAGLSPQLQHQIQQQIQQQQPQHLGNLQIQTSGPAGQFLGSKGQSVDFATQTEKSSSSNYNPVYRTAYVKG